MFSKNYTIVSRFRAAIFCVVGCAALVFNLANVSAQKTRLNAVEQNFGGSPIMSATLTDAYPDPDGDGRAAFGAEVTYTATVTNNGAINATNVTFTNPIDGNSTLVAGSVQVQPDLSSYAIRCTFNTAGGGSGSCSLPTNPYGVTDSNLNTIIGGQFDYLTVASANPSYNSGTEIFQFDANVQNLISNALGTLDGVTLDDAGIRLFLQNSRITSGAGSISVANADGTGTFTDANQPYFQYAQILQKDEVSSAKTVQLSVPNTVGAFTVEFLVSTKTQVKVVFNEVLSNPGGTISDANGEWFELYNAGQFPVNLKNFLINDFASADSNFGCEIGPNGTTNYCARPPHTIASDLIIPSGGYETFGNTTNTTNNGGVPVDYAYGSALALANSLDGLRLRTPGGLVIDKTFYASAAISAQNGISRELKNQALDNSNMDDQTNWADAGVTAVYGPGGRGTPKAQNSTFTPLVESFTGKSFADKSSVNKSSVDKTSAVTNFAPVVSIVGETVSASLGTISPGGSAIVTYRVTVADPMPSAVTQISNQGSVSGDNFGDVVSDDPATGAANDATVTPVGTLSPTSASVNIGGQVLDNSERAVSGALVEMVDSNGTTSVTRTNAFGFFNFENIEAGQTIVLNVTSKRYQFTPQILNVTEDFAGLNFTANP
jgi:uncharacterized repeat protein (TIGR01451 family)